ncbi:MAG TPA: SPOR domain-containing protein [Novosphingobium sp.]
MVIGERYTVGGVIWTPADKLNYDEVGHVSVGTAGGAGISIAHKTLPLPSYAELTSLTNGKTILVRVERRGPLDNDLLAELSPGAAAQLGLTGKASIRLRRVNPPEVERAALRSGQRAPERIDTPKGLLDALVRKLERQGSKVSRTAMAETPPSTLSTISRQKARSSAAAKSVNSAAPVAAASPVASSAPTRPVVPPVFGGFVVQIAAFSTKDRADSVAGKLGGQVSSAGRFWRVRAGPFPIRSGAEVVLAKVKSAGYSDARILHVD